MYAYANVETERIVRRQRTYGVVAAGCLESALEF